MSDYHSSDPPTTPGRTWTSLSTYTRFDPRSSEDSSSDIYTRRTILSPAPSDYNDASSAAEEAEVEATLSSVDGSSSRWDTYVLDPYNFPPRILSMITERTEDPQSRPNSFRSSTIMPPRPASAAASSVASSHYESLPPRSITPGNISQAMHGRSRTASPERPPRPPPRSGRAIDLIAFFEDKDKSVSELSSSQSRTFRSPVTTSSPSFPSSSSSYRRTQSESSTSYNTVPRTTTIPTLDSRSISPVKSVLTLSSLLSPARTETRSAYSTAVSSSKQLPRTPTSPRSPLHSVRKIVAAWKERTPSLGKSTKASSVVSDSSYEGFFSIKRSEPPEINRSLPPIPVEADGSNAGSGKGTAGLNIVKSAKGSNGSNSNGNGSERKSVSSGSSSNKTPFDIAELGPFAQPDREPLRVGQLWYLNVHASPPFRWIRTQAVLYPHVLVLSWIAPGGGRGIITLDLLNCNEVRSVPSPNHPSAQDDIGTIAAREQATGSGPERALREFLCPFQLFYPDGLERLGADSARERVRWVGAIWEALNRAVTLPDPSVRSRSPAPSIGTIKSESSSSSGSKSQSGSRSTVFVPPLDTLPDIGGSSAASVSSRSSLVGAVTSPLDDVGLYRRRASDDAAIDSTGMLYPVEGSKVIAPSRSSSLRRTSSLEDLNTEFKSVYSAPRSVVFGKPVTVSSGPSTPGNVIVSPPPSAGKRSRIASAKTSSEASESATFRTAPSRLSARTTPASSYYSFPPSQRASSQGESPSVSPLRTLQSIPSDSPQIRVSTLSLRGSQSASLLGDSHDGDLSDSNSLASYSSSTPSGKRVTFPTTTTSPKTPSKTTASTLYRSPGIRRRTPRKSSTRKSSSSESVAPYVTAVEGSDKENDSTIDSAIDSNTQTLRPAPTADSEDLHQTPTRHSYTATPTTLSELPTFTRTSTYGSIGYDICQSSDLSDFTPLSMTMADSYSAVGSIPDQEQYDSDPFLSGSERPSDSDVFLTAPGSTTTFFTTRTPSPTSTHFSTASRAPSSTQYDTAVSQGSTEFHTAPSYASTEYASLESIPSSNEYQTAELCSEYETAPKCPSTPSTQYQTVEPCPCPSTPSTKSLSIRDLPALPASPEIVEKALSVASGPESVVSVESLPSLDSLSSPSPTPQPESLHDITPISTATEEEESTPVYISTPTPDSSPTPPSTPLPPLSSTISSVSISMDIPTPSSPSTPTPIVQSLPSMTTLSISTDLGIPSTVSSAEEPSEEEMPTITPSSVYDEQFSIVSSSRPPSRMSTIPSLPDESSPRLTPLSSLEPSTRLSTVTESDDTVPFTVSLSVSSESSLRPSMPSVPSMPSTVSPVSPSLLTLSSRSSPAPSVSSESDASTGTFLIPSSISTTPQSPSLPESSEELTSIPSLPSPSTPMSVIQASLYEESTGSYDSTLLEPSVSAPSLPFQEGPDVSFDTSLLGPTVSAQSETPGIRFPMTPVPPTPPPPPPSSSPPPSPPQTPPALSPPQITVQPSTPPPPPPPPSPPPPSEHTVSSPTTESSSELPLSVVDIPLPASPSRAPSSLTPSSPFLDLPILSPRSSPSMLSPQSEPHTTPFPSSSSSESFQPTISLTPSLTRTPSTVSSVSMRSSRISPDEESLYEFEVTPTSTESTTTWRPTLSSESSVTRESIISRSLTPSESTISPSSPSSPMPPSASSSSSSTITTTSIPRSLTITPQASFSVSVSTPWSNVPSIRSQLETISSRASEDMEPEPREMFDVPQSAPHSPPPSSILTHDVNRLLHYLHDINDIRNGQHVDLHRHIDDIGQKLDDLATRIQDEMTSRQPPPPPVRQKDVSVGRSSVSSRATTPVPRRSPTPTPSFSSVPNVRASVLSSITTSSSSVSWLSSHHSDDWDLMSSEDLEALPVIVQPPSPPSSPSTPSSPSSVSSPSSDPDDGYSESSSSLTPQPVQPPPSPTPSVETVRPQEEQVPAEPHPTLLILLDNIRTELDDLRSHCDQTRRSIDELRDETRQAADRQPVQIVIPPRAEIIREERAVPDEEQHRMYTDMIRDMQRTLQDVKDMLSGEGRTVTMSESSHTDDIDPQSLFDFPPAPAPPPASIPLHAPTPVPARSPPAFISLLTQLSSRLPEMPPTSATIPLEPLPSIRIPTSRPRPRSASPSTIIRSSSAPVTGTGQRPAGVPPFVPPESSVDDEGPSVTAPQQPSQVHHDPGRSRLTPTPRSRHLGEGQLPSFDGQPTQRTSSRPPPQHEVPPRVPTAPPAFSVFRRGPPRGAAPFQPTPQQLRGGPPVAQQTIPVPVAPAVPPPEYNEILRILRIDQDARHATLEQQGEMINYMRSLNNWLERDVRDRHAEIQGVGARIDQLRNDISRYLGIPAAVPFVPAPYPPPTFPPPRIFHGGPPVPPAAGPGRGTPFRGLGRRPQEIDDEDEPFIPPHPDTFADVPAGFVPRPGGPPPGFWAGGPSVYPATPAGFVPQQGRGAPFQRPGISVVSPSPSGRPRRTFNVADEDDDEDGDIRPFVPPRVVEEVSPARTRATATPGPGPRPPPDPNAPPAVDFTQTTVQPPTQQFSDAPRTHGFNAEPGATVGPSREAPESTQTPLIIIPPPAQQQEDISRPERSPGAIIVQPAPEPSRRPSRSRSRLGRSQSRPSQIIIRSPVDGSSDEEDIRGRSQTPTNIIIQPSRPASRPPADDIGRIPPVVIRDQQPYHSSSDRDPDSPPPPRRGVSGRRTPSRRSSRRPSGSQYGDPGRQRTRDPSPEYSPEDPGRPSRSRTPFAEYPSRRPSRVSSRGSRRPTSIRLPDSGSESISDDVDQGGPILVVPPSARSSRHSRSRDGGITVIPRPDRSRSPTPPREIHIGRDTSRGRSRSRPPIILEDRPSSVRSHRSTPQVIIPQRSSEDDDFDQPTFITQGRSRDRTPSRPPVILSRPSRPQSRSSVILPPERDESESPPVIYAQPSPRRSRPPSIVYEQPTRSRSRPPSILQSRPSSRASGRPSQTVIIPRSDSESPPADVIVQQSRPQSRQPSVIYSDRTRSRPSSQIYQDPRYLDEGQPTLITRSRPPSRIYQEPRYDTEEQPPLVARSRPSSQIYQDPYGREELPREILPRPPSAISHRSSRRPSPVRSYVSGRRTPILPPEADLDAPRERPPAVLPTRGRSPSVQPVGSYVDEDSPLHPPSVRPSSVASRRSYRLGDGSRTPRATDAYESPRPIRPLSPEAELEPLPSRPPSGYFERPGSRTSRLGGAPSVQEEFSDPREQALYDDDRAPRTSSRTPRQRRATLVPGEPDYMEPEPIVPIRPSPTYSYGDAAVRQPPVSRPPSVHSSRRSFSAGDRQLRISRAPTVIPGELDDEGFRPSSPELVRTRPATPPGPTPRGSPTLELGEIPRTRSPSVIRTAVPASPELVQQYPVSPPQELPDIPGPVGVPGPLATPSVDGRISLPPERPESAPVMPLEERIVTAFNNAEDERRLRYQDAEHMRDDAAIQAEQRRDAEFEAHETERQRVFEENEARRNQTTGQIREQIIQAASERGAGDAPPFASPSVPGEVLGDLDDIPGDAPIDAPVSPSDDVLPDIPGGVPPDPLATLTPDPIGEADAERAESERARSIRETVHSVLDTQADAVRNEVLLGAQNERQELYKLIESERQRNAEYEAKVKALEEEIVTLRDTQEAEKVEREREQAAKLDQFQADLAQRDTDMRDQLANITQLLEEKKAECERLRAENEARFADKESRRVEKEAKCDSMKEMLQQIIREQEEAKLREQQEREERAGRAGLEEVLLEALKKHQGEQNAFIHGLVDEWKGDCERQNKDLLDAVKATAQEQVPYNVEKYLNHFSQTLADEVRILLGEVGKLREEKRNIQHEIGFLLCTRSKYGPGGEFDPEWRPNIPLFGGPPGGPGGFPPGGFGGGFPGGFPPGPGGFPPGGFPPPGFDDGGPPPSDGDEQHPVRPAWRNVPPAGPPKLSKRQRRQKAAEEAAAAAAAGPGAGPSMVHPMGPMGGGMPEPRMSWATWQPDPQFVPTPTSAADRAELVPPAVPSPPGLFGPRSLSPKRKKV